MFFCPKHQRSECGAATARGYCHQPGQEPCWRHRAGTEIVPADAAAPVHVDAYSVSYPGPVTPRAGMVLMLQVSWARWQEYARLLHDQVYGTAAQPAAPGSTEGLVGFTTDFDRFAPDGGVYATGEAPRALVQIEAAERDRFTKLCVQAHGLGITEDEWLPA
jgi:hypothetical protein